ncbi:hypothetical protein GCM10009827_058410 [Dactylosporangium maewongense]|uniref:Uncharacterized protein n=1 Tax=Dactylosporangium maewongense TaxID=634393 RepID=A0ABN2B4I6_9ACTN
MPPANGDRDASRSSGGAALLDGLPDRLPDDLADGLWGGPPDRLLNDLVELNDLVDRLWGGGPPDRLLDDRPARPLDWLRLRNGRPHPRP